MKDPMEALSALRQSERQAADAGRTWEAYDAFEAVQPYLRTGPSDASVIAFLVIMLSSVGFLLWLVFG